MSADRPISEIYADGVRVFERASATGPRPPEYGKYNPEKEQKFWKMSPPAGAGRFVLVEVLRRNPKGELIVVDGVVQTELYPVPTADMEVLNIPPLEWETTTRDKNNTIIDPPINKAKMKPGESLVKPLSTSDAVVVRDMLKYAEEAVATNTFEKEVLKRFDRLESKADEIMSQLARR